MMQFNIFQSHKQDQERELSKEELQHCIQRYLSDHPKVAIRSLLSDEDIIDYKLLKKYLKCKPINRFLMSKETGEIFEETEENHQLVQWINATQQATDQYVYDKQIYPLKEDSDQLEVCYMKLKPYLKTIPTIPLYVSEKYFTISNKPDRK